MFVRTIQIRFINPNTMVYANKKLIQEGEEIYKQFGCKSITVVKTGTDRLSNIGVWEKDPGNKVFEKLADKYKELAKKYEFHSIVGSGSVEILGY